MAANAWVDWSDFSAAYWGRLEEGSFRWSAPPLIQDGCQLGGICHALRCPCSSVLFINHHLYYRLWIVPIVLARRRSLMCTDSSPEVHLKRRSWGKLHYYISTLLHKLILTLWFKASWRPVRKNVEEIEIWTCCNWPDMMAVFGWSGPVVFWCLQTEFHLTTADKLFTIHEGLKFIST
jgi:hypothetical protein